MFFEQKVFSYYQRNRENLAPWIFLPSPIFELVSLFSFSRLPVFDQLLVKQLCSKIFFDSAEAESYFFVTRSFDFEIYLVTKKDEADEARSCDVGILRNKLYW